MKQIPLFKSHYSIGRSILTLEDPSERDENQGESRADSIFSIAKDHDLSTVFLLDDNPSGFINAVKVAKKNKIKICLGVRLTICNDANNSSEDKSDESKVCIWGRGDSGYHRIYKIFSQAAINQHRNYPRTDITNLKALWSEEDLYITIPFYDSFIHKNALGGGRCTPSFDFTKPFLHIEQNDLPFDPILLRSVDKWQQFSGWEGISVKSVYYNTRADFEYYMARRCLDNRSSFEKPELPHMASDAFCMEALIK